MTRLFIDTNVVLDFLMERAGYREAACIIVKVASVTSEDFMGALELKSRDFEDALQYFCAKSYHCDRIVTRNEKDFYFSDIKVCSPVEFLSEIL